MKQYWTNLNDRERLAVLIGGIGLVCYLFYLLVYEPLSDAVALKTQQLEERQSTLAWMKRVRHQSVNTTPRTEIANTQQLLTMLASQLKDTSFKTFPYQLQQTDGGNIQLSFDSVPLNPFLIWLKSMHERYAFSIELLSAEKKDKPGIVKLYLVLSENK